MIICFSIKWAIEVKMTIFYKNIDIGQATFDAHSRKNIKVKPFKCRICSARFETRELAGVHAKTHCPDFFKCGTCSLTFTQKVREIEENTRTKIKKNLFIHQMFSLVKLQLTGITCKTF